MSSQNALVRRPGRTAPPQVEKFREALKFRFPPVFRPRQSIKVGDTVIELWVSPRRMPMLFHADAMIVPVSPNLRMVSGPAKLARDAGADRVQHEALRIAPLEPGQVFVGAGARYHFKMTALAVIFDTQKRTDASVIRQAVRNAAAACAQRGAKSVILPDFTESLLAQPNWLSEEEYRATAETSAAALAEAANACVGLVARVKIWCWNDVSVGLFLRELKRIERSANH